jgi:hypothetical protein
MGIINELYYALISSGSNLCVAIENQILNFLLPPKTQIPANTSGRGK